MGLLFLNKFDKNVSLRDHLNNYTDFALVKLYPINRKQIFTLKLLIFVDIFKIFKNMFQKL